MKFKIGDKVEIKPEKVNFYENCLPYLAFTGYKGVLRSSNDVFSDISFKNDRINTVFTEDIRLITKNQQLLFEFYRTDYAN